MHSQKSLPMAALPKAAFPFSPILPEVKLLMKIPSCSAESFILHTRWCNTQPRGERLQHTPCSKRSPSLFCFHFSFFFSFFISPVGKCNEMMVRNEKNEATHWLWK